MPLYFRKMYANIANKAAAAIQKSQQLFLLGSTFVVLLWLYADESLATDAALMFDATSLLVSFSAFAEAP